MKSAIILILTITVTIHATTYLEVKRPSERLYSVNSEICCDGTIYENKSSTDFACCGGKLIQTDSEVCCYPTGHQFLYHKLCCGNRYYNTIFYDCRRMSMRTKTHTLEDWSMRRALISGEVNDTQTTCGDEVLDLDKDICCNYQIVANPDKKLECCGTDGYDSSTHVCCNTTHDVKTKAKNDPKDDACCNGTPYESETKVCVKNELVDRPSVDHKVCHDTLLYNDNDQICCGKNSTTARLITKSEPDHWECCGELSYTNKESHCCVVGFGVPGGEVAKLYTRDEAMGKDCCGTELYDIPLFCCGGQNIYDPENQTCCELVYPDLRIEANVYEGAEQKCCGAELLDVKKEECCGYIKVPNLSIGEKSGCCVNTIVNPTNEPEVLTQFLRRTRYYTDD